MKEKKRTGVRGISRRRKVDVELNRLNADYFVGAAREYVERVVMLKESLTHELETCGPHLKVSKFGRERMTAR